MNLVTFDFETYFDQDYSLSKMTTEAYVRDPRFKVHTLGVRDPELGIYADPGAGILSSYLTMDPLWDRASAFLCHHAQFDGLILSHHYNIKPAFWFDTLSMARLVFPHAKSHSLKALSELLGLPEKTVPYNDFKGVRDLSPELYTRVAEGCVRDVELTYEIFTRLLPMVPREELRIIDLTIRMFTEPALRLDRDRLKAYLEQSEIEKEKLLMFCGATKTDLNSSEKFAALIEKLGVEAPTKISPITGKKIYAFAKTDAGFEELLEHPDERVAVLAEARLGAKSNIMETRGGRMLSMDERGAMCVYLKYCGAHTTRWSGGDKMNWQNLKRGSALRDSILAPKGYVMVVIDSSQIECRMLNWLAGQTDKLDAFREGRDLYSEMASVYFGHTVTKQDKGERMLGKVMILACGYGMGGDKFKTTACSMAGIGLSHQEAKTAVATYRSNHPQVVRLWRKGDGMIKVLLGGRETTWGPMRVANYRIYLPNGAPLDYSNLKLSGDDVMAVSRKGASKLYGAKLVENVVQALSRVVISQAMLEVAKRYRIVTCTHDEIVYLALENEADEAYDFGMDIMKRSPVWAADLPLNAEGGYARNYSK